MIVDPSLENLFGWKLQEILEFFTIFQETENLIAVLEIDSLSSQKADNLPNDSENKVWLFIQESLSIDSDNFNQTSAGCKELIQVLSNFVNVQVCTFVDGSEIDSIWVKFVKKMKTDHTITDGIKDLCRVWINGESLLQFLNFGELFVDRSGKGTDLFIKIGGYCTTGTGLLLSATDTLDFLNNVI